MLRFIIGRAGAGKTAYVMNEIKHRIDSGETGVLFIVPDQYSHDAERQLCGICGDRLSMHGEVLSFTRLCRNVIAQTGGASLNLLDTGGQVLVLYRAMMSIAPSLKAFGSGNLRTELLENLCDSIKEFKMLGILPEKLKDIAERSSNPLSDKLHDLSLIYSTYESMLYTLMPSGDTTDLMTLLADNIKDSAIGDTGHIYIDGFNDFTAQELRVIEELMQKNAEITICLTYDDKDMSEAFKLPRKTMAQLRRLADSCGIDVKIFIPEDKDAKAGLTEQAGIAFGRDELSSDKADALVFLEKYLFGRDIVKYSDSGGIGEEIMVYAAPSRYLECEYAAHEIIKMARSGHRWRDIAVMARDWDKYDALCANVFEKYDIPYFTGGRSEILSKPTIALLDTALEIIVSGWEYKPIFRYIKTSLPGISADDCALLEKYVLKWNIRGTSWVREWTLPPEGYFDLANHKPQTDSALLKLNELRQQIIKPFIRLKDGIKGDTPIAGKLNALYRFIEDIRLPEVLLKKADEFERRGEKRLADEYAQTWNIIKVAMEQIHKIFGFDAEDSISCSVSEFRKLFILTLSCYDVGAIPASLDRTTLGGIQMNRRRDLKCLIFLGATDDDLPMLSDRGGVLSNSERSDLINLGVDIPAGFEERLNREMNMIYSTFTLPTEKLVLSRPTGAGERPSQFIKRVRSMFDLDEITLKEEEYMTAAKTPCFELASYSGKTNFSPIAAAAREYFIKYSDEGDRLIESDESALSNRGRLSKDFAKRLYGVAPTLTASRVDKYYSCPYLYFLHSGLKLKPLMPAGMDAMTAGLFMHYILENVFREIGDTTGIKNADLTECMKIVKHYVNKFASEILYDFVGKNSRFVYLFNRLEHDAYRIVQDMLEELKNSDFKPLDFEFDISTLTDDDNAKQKLDGLTLRGIVDRIDGWEGDDGNLYLRVVDYKTGKKTMSPANLLHGLDMQMLIYLFALERLGMERFGDNIIPAGVMYIPARDAILDAARNSSDEDIRKGREKAAKRSGLLLDDMNVVDAMEGGPIKRFLPVKHRKDGIELGDSFISREQTGLLSEHVSHMLKRAAKEISDGNIDCSPFYKNINENACTYCDYRSVCGFDRELGDSPRIARSIKAEEVWERLRGQHDQT